METIKVAGAPNLGRDKKSGAIINMNTNEFSVAKAVRARRKERDQEFEDIKTELAGIRILLGKLMEEK